MTEYEEPFDDSIEQSSDKLLDEDELSPGEQGFMKGYDEAYEADEEEDEIDKEFE